MPGRAQLEQKVVALELLHPAQFLEPMPQGFELAPAHRPLLVHAVHALGQNVAFARLGQQFDLHARAHFLPGFVQELFLQPAQPSLGRAHDVENGRITLPHLRQRLFGRNAPIHHPDAPGLAVELFNLLQKHFERGLVGRVARQHFVRQRKTFRRDHQRDDHLHAVKTFVPAVTKLALVRFRKRRVTFKISARQIVEQHVVGDAKESLPACFEKTEQRLLVLQQFVQTPVERILGRQRKILPQQIGHRTLLEPLPVQPPFTARSNEPVGAQHREHMRPRRALPTVGQPLFPETVQLQLPPQLQEQPARAPLAWMTNEKIAQAHLHAALSRVNGNVPVGRKESQTHLLLALGIKDLDAAQPALLLTVVDFAQIEHVTLHDAPTAATPTFHDGPIPMLLAVLEPAMTFDMHDGLAL